MKHLVARALAVMMASTPAAMAADDYRKQLQDLLIQLAKTQAELDK